MSAQTPILTADPHANYLAHKTDIDAAIFRVLQRGRYILGDEVAAFEHEFAGYLGIGHAVGVANGTDAIELALRAAGIGPGDQVIAPSHTAVATIAAIERAGAEPLLVDIEPATMVIDPNQVKQALTPRVRAVVAVHLYGQPANVSALRQIADQDHLILIEDCAQSHGAKLQDRVTGTWGELGAFSFYPTKNLGALGDAGAVVTNDNTLAQRLRQLREYGWHERYVSELRGVNSRLDELQAAVLRVKLKHIEPENRRRCEIASRYTSRLATTCLTLPQPTIGHVFHQYVIRCRRRDALREHLEAHGVHTLIHYPVPIHLQAAYRERVAIAPAGLAHTEAVCREILSLPVHPQLTEDQVDFVTGLIARWAESNR